MKTVSIVLTALFILTVEASGCQPVSAPASTVKAATPAAVSTSAAGQGQMQQLWQENSAVYRKILTHPYNQNLLNGTLDESIFREFIVQDYHFCLNYKKVHGILLSKAPNNEASAFMVKYIGYIDEEIAALHAGYIGKYNIPANELSGPPAYPSTELYNSYLVKTAALETFEVGLAATIPCHWVYFQVGSDMKKLEKVQGNKYQAWIDLYGSASWEDSETSKIVSLTEKYMQQADPATRLKMKQAFSTAMKLEYMFWDGVYQRAKWIE